MAIGLTVAYVLHVAFAALWAGSVLFVTYGVLPSGRTGDIAPGPFATAVGRLTTVNRSTAVVALLTGGYMAGERYTFEALSTTQRGHLVLGMALLWLVATGLIEAAGSRMRDGLDDDKVRTPAEDGRPFLLGASVVVALLLVDAGLLAAGVGP